MKPNIQPKAENANKGFHYTVTDEQIREHQQRSLEEIFEWLEKTNKFVYELRTPEEREIAKKMKNIEL